MSKNPYYQYYDTPDGEDYLKKQYLLLRKAALIGGIHATIDVMGVSKPVGLVPVCERFLRCFFHPLVVSVIFESTVYIATNVRKKDDPWNHVFGGLAATYFLSQNSFNRPLAWSFGLPCCFGLYLCKLYKQRYNSVLVYDNYLVREETCSGPFTRYNVWSWDPQLPREWLRADEVPKSS